MTDEPEAPEPQGRWIVDGLIAPDVVAHLLDTPSLIGFCPIFGDENAAMALGAEYGARVRPIGLTPMRKRFVRDVPEEAKAAS